MEALHPERTLSHGPLFQVMFVFQNAAHGKREVGDIELSLLETDFRLEKFGLTFLIAEDGEQLNCSLSYATDIFDKRTIERLGSHWRQMLEAMTADPDQSLWDVKLLSDTEQEDILRGLNETSTTWAEGSVLRRFEKQVELTPEGVAVEFEGQHFTYREISARANQLAHHLRSLGVAADSRVGIFLERGSEMLVGLLAVLKAGGAYVPLDPSYPKERLNYMLANAQCTVVLTTEQLLVSLPQTDAKVLCLDKDREQIATESSDTPAIQIDPENLAFVVYTSGSTGWPKGVALTHRGLGNLIAWQVAEYGGPARAVQFASFSFDVSFQEVFTTWCSGGTLLLVTDELRKDVKRMLRFLSEQQVERIDVPFVYLQQLAEAYADDDSLPLRLREIISAGEQLESTSQIAQLCERLGCRLFNHYGPSETHVVVTHALSNNTREWPTLPPIGRPIANAQIYILDRNLQPAPMSVSGEVFIGGANLSRGYLHRPELTAERYIPNPFSDNPGERLYRTGDLARYLSNGEIDFRGRIDTQVKIRGFRIELGEIEATLREHPGVLHAAVVDRVDTFGKKRLVAYVVGNQDEPVKIDELKQYLNDRLPEYMNPAAWMMLEKLPLTPSGKLDRAALPAIDMEAGAPGASFAAPRTLIEENLAGIWEHILELERIGRDDNFFWLGGHSLLATRIISRVREVFQVELPVRALFESPTVAELATRIEELINSGGSLSAPPPHRRSRDGHLPLSYAQQRLWFLDQLQPGGNAYNLQELTYLDSGVNLGALEQSFGEVMRRHEALRTVFKVTDGEPEQVINPPRAFSVTLVDLSALADREQQAAAERLRQEDELRPFDLSSGPLLQITVLRLAGDRYQLLVSMHHIVSDGWSMDVARSEIETLYTVFSRGLPSPLPELQIQYADYAQWQQEWLQGEVLERQVDYWKQQLSGTPTLLELKTDRASRVLRTQRGTALPVMLSKEVSRSLREFSRREGATLFMTLMAAFQALLQRYAGQNDIIVGTPIAGRIRSELEPMIGFFVNTVALRTNFDENPSFRRLLKQVREAALGAHAHQEVPFEKLVEELRPERVPGRNPLCQVIFALQNAGQPTVVTASMPRAGMKFDLELYLWDTPNGVSGSFIYRTDLYEQPFIERLVNRFQRLIEQVVTRPDAELSTLSLLGEKEYRQVIEEWNDTTSDFPASACIHEVFEQEVEQHPDAVAVEFEDQNLSYRELNRRANMLAHRLRENGVGPEVFVGVMVERSTELIVSLLAVCKAGGVYVPINLSDPSSRIRLLLKDAGISTVVTSNEIARRMTDLDVTTVCVDDLGSTSREHAENLPRAATADNLAYLMYTSGSTGTPKGVSITHRNVLRLVKNTNYADLDADEVILQFAPISFDASTFEIWGALLNGGRLAVFPPFMPSLAELSEFITSRGITTAWFTSGLFNQLVEADVQSLSSLRQILAGGEALSPAHVNKALGQLNGCRLINGYGPTETTTFACCYHIQPNGGRSSIPIGRPISNTSAYVLQGMQPVGVGERGELFIGGDGVGRGYHNRPDLTADRFAPDPYGRPGARLYRTGDVVRYLNEGLIEFLGRVDSQVKLSGFRIELGEIEAVLSQHPAVSTALVQMRETGSGDKTLVAYIVPNGGAPASNEDLKNYLQERLPGYMVPGMWITLETLPLTRTGKIDRLALPDPIVVRDADFEFAPPRTQLEEVLASIWERVMGLERVGRNANFFALGGHSLLATRIIARIRESFQVELPVRALFEAPTLAQLSEHIEAAMRTGDSLVAPPLVRRSATEPLPLSFAQQRLWFLDQLMPGTSIYNIPMGLRLTGKINVAALEQSFNEAIRRHESLRTNFIEVNGNPVQVIAPARKVQLPVVDLVSFSEPEREAIVQRLASAEGQRPFDLASDPLLRGTLLRVAEHEYVLLVVMHHIISDGWTMHVLSRELRQCSQAFAEGKPSLLPDLTIQYADYARWQRLWLQGEALEVELSYWRTQLKDSPPLLNLPTDYPRPSVSSYKGEALLFELPAELTQPLKQLSNATRTTLFMTLLASFQMLLSRYSGQDDIVVGTPVAGRRWVETEDLIGFFVNTLVIRTRLSNNPTIREVLGRVREVVLESQTHQDLPFEKLVEELHPERTLSHGPLFQVMFGLENTGDAPAATQTDELGATDVEVKHGAEKNDLTLLVSEQNGRLFCRLSYSTALFKESTIKRLRSHWQNLLHAMVADPEQLLRDVQLLGAEEQRQMLQDWNATQSEFPESECVFELFAQQAERTPDAIAVSFENERVTYAELDRRANQLAHYLRKHEVANETRVAIFFERSVEMIVALMGVLKAGGAYMPLETKHPKARVQYMLEDAQARVILTQQKLVTRLPENSATVIPLDADWQQIAAEPDYAPKSTLVPENLAYVIYTSGSTGTARGVMVQHRSLVNLAATLWAVIYRDRSTPLRVSVNAPLMFDSSVKQLVQLLHGHELAIIPEEIRTEGQELLAYLKQEQIDVLDCTPSQLRLLLASGFCEESTRYPSLALIGGEALDEETWQLLAGSKQTIFFNVYGPTECTVDTTVCRIEPTSQEPSIGFPLNNVETYVADMHLHPVPVGVHGELCIGGTGVARGYISQPDATAARFVPDPFSDVPGARLYRSGDLTRYRENGEIEFLGRIDYQVKIRGHRIEPGEVEAALRKNSRVLEAVVLDREQGGDKRLVAYIVPEHRQVTSLAELQNSLKDQLPDYMMPSGWVLLDKMPLTPTGKIDRAALPDPGRARLDTGQSFVVPQTLIEEVLANIWKEVLAVEAIARDDNFFWLGGHSLLATQIMSRIRESFNVEIPVRTLFESPTLVELSERIESTMLSGTSMAAPLLEQLPDDGPLYLSYAQQRLWFLDQLMPGSNAYNLPAELHIDSEVNVAALEQSLSEIVRRHQTLRTTFFVAGGQPVQRVDAPSRSSCR